MIERRFFLILFVLVSLATTGCAKLAHLQELLTLKAYSDEGTAQGQYIKAQDAKFEKMLLAVQDGSLNEYTKGSRFRAAFGDPVYIRPVTKDGAPCDEWLYRYAREYFDSEKIYIYFTSGGQLLRWEYVPAPTKETNDGQALTKKCSADHCPTAQ